MKLLYIHNVDISTHSANLTQVISMCKAFNTNHIDTNLLLPITNSNEADKIERKIRETYNIEQEITIRFFSNVFKHRRIRKFTNHLFLKKHIRKINPDFCYTRDVNFLSQCLSNKVPSIYESHNDRIHNGSSLINNFLKRKLIRKAASKKYLFTVTISEMLKKYWIDQGMNDSDILALHDGFIAEKYQKQLSKDEARRKLNLPLNEKLIIYTGNLYPNRGVDQVLRLAKKFKEQTFIVVGGPERFKENLFNQAAVGKIYNIKFIGQIPFSQIHLYQFAADINLGIWSKEVPTIQYCSPLKIFEYMAVGRIIVAMGFPSIKEVLVDGVNSFVSDPNESDDFENKVAFAIDNEVLSRDTAKRAREQAFEEFTWEKRVEKILQRI